MGCWYLLRLITAPSHPAQVSPFWTYLTTLPRLLLATALFIPIGFIQDRRIRSLVRPALLYIFLMSLLAHKEWRFVVYVVPLFNIAAAHGAQTLWVVLSSPLRHRADTILYVVRKKYSLHRRKRSIWGKLALLTVAGALALNTAATVLLTRASMANYPGGSALALLNERYADSAHGKPTISSLLRNAQCADRPTNVMHVRQCTSTSQTLPPRAAPRSSFTHTRRLTANAWASFRPLILPFTTTHGFIIRLKTSRLLILPTAPNSRT